MKRLLALVLALVMLLCTACGEKEAEITAGEEYAYAKQFQDTMSEIEANNLRDRKKKLFNLRCGHLVVVPRFVRTAQKRLPR